MVSERKKNVWGVMRESPAPLFMDVAKRDCREIFQELMVFTRFCGIYRIPSPGDISSVIGGAGCCPSVGSGASEVGGFGEGWELVTDEV